MYKILTALLFTLSAALIFAVATAAEKIECQDTEGDHCLHSELLNQNLKLLVNLPDSYDPKDRKRYPVVYVLDGQWDFGLLRDIYGKLHYDRDIPDAIIVGITWSGENLDIDAMRWRDLVPNKDTTLGAQRFLNVLETELIPHIDRRFKTNSKRVITGTSLGGLFTTYALLERPMLFGGYLALAPAYHKYPKPLMRQQLAELKSKIAKSKIKVYVACGSRDGCVRKSLKLAQDLKDLKIKNLRVKHDSLKGINHAGATPVGNTHGLIYIF